VAASFDASGSPRPLALGRAAVLIDRGERAFHSFGSLGAIRYRQQLLESFSPGDEISQPVILKPPQLP
jgi:hypothetical protein